MALTFLDRVQTILDLVADSLVANEGAYAQVDKMDLATTIKYCEAAWDLYYTPEDPENPIENPTDEEKAMQLVKTLKKFHGDMLSAQRVPAAGKDAAEAEKAAVQTEVQNDFGEEPPV